MKQTLELTLWLTFHVLMKYFTLRCHFLILWYNQFFIVPVTFSTSHISVVFFKFSNYSKIWGFSKFWFLAISFQIVPIDQLLQSWLFFGFCLFFCFGFFLVIFLRYFCYSFNGCNMVQIWILAMIQTTASTATSIMTFF